MASYWRKKQKTDANVTSVIIVVAHVFLERKPMAGLFQNGLKRIEKNSKQNLEKRHK